MAVLCEAISVIVPVATLERRFPGGLAGYRRLVPNRTYCCDGKLTRVGFMAPADANHFVNAITRYGLVFHDGSRFVDIAVVDQTVGPTAPCDWLEAGRHPDGYAAAWMTGSEPSPLAVPTGWTPEQSRRMRMATDRDVADHLTPLARERGSDVFLDFRTGREVYIGRTTTDPLKR